MKVVTENLVSDALAASGRVAWRWDAQADRMEWSTGAEEILGLPDIVLRSPDLLIRAIHPDDVELIKGQFCEALKTGAPLAARFRVTAASGLRWFDCSGQALLSENGESVGATGTFAEVTEECEAEEAVLQSLRDAECALEQIGARVWEWDPETDLVTYFNLPEGTHIIAESPTALSLADILKGMTPADAAQAREALTRAVETGERFSLEVGVRDDSGVSHRVFVRGGVLAHQPGRVSAITIVLD